MLGEAGAIEAPASPRSIEHVARWKGPANTHTPRVRMAHVAVELGRFPGMSRLCRIAGGRRHASIESMLRWRLRYHLQEIDLRPGRTILGRGPECPITFDDALVSRQHAEIFVCEDGCLLTDLNSRNGVRVNAVRLRSPKLLSPNDRIRLGRDELVLLVDTSADSQVPERPTAVKQMCERCGHEHVADLPLCPACGVTAGAGRAAIADVT